MKPIKKLKNEELIKDLIKMDYDIPLDFIKEIDFIMTNLVIKTTEDWDKVNDYINWYTEKTKKYEDWWTKDKTFSLYYDYLTKMNGVRGREAFPKKDMFYILDTMKIIESNAKDELREIVIKRTMEQYEKLGLYWDREEE